MEEEAAGETRAFRSEPSVVLFFDQKGKLFP